MLTDIFYRCSFHIVKLNHIKRTHAIKHFKCIFFTISEERSLPVSITKGDNKHNQITIGCENQNDPLVFSMMILFLKSSVERFN